jgi:addiction module HigA family antidote
MTRWPEHRRPVHPGEVLREECLEPLGISQTEAAERLGISYPRLNEVVNGRRSVTPDTALRLARLFDTEPEFWLNLQQSHDPWAAMHAPAAADFEEFASATG